MLNSGGHFTFRKRIATIVIGNQGALGSGGTINTTTQFRTVGSVKLSTVAYSHPHYAVNATPTTVTCFIDATGGLNVGDFIYTNFGLTNKKYSSNPLLTGQTLYIENYDENIYAIDFNANGSIKTIYNAATAAPTPIYSITPSTTSINEGQSVTFNVATTWVDNNTTLYWSDSGTVGSADFTQGIASGSVYISAGNFVQGVPIGSASNSNTGSGSFLLTAANDLLTEGNETLIARLRTGSTSGTIVATASTVTVVDTSKAPTYAIAPNVTSINEGQSVVYTVTTANVANGTVLYWSNNPSVPSGSGGTSINDFTQQVMSGQVTINNNTATITLTANQDRLTELAQEEILLKLRTGSTSGTVVSTSVPVYINDTSKDPWILVSASATTIQEPGTVTFSITSHSIDPGTTVTWTNTGTTSAGDFVENVTNGTVELNSAGVATVTLTVKDEDIIESNETIVFNVSAPTVFGTVTSSVTVTVTNAGQSFAIQANTFQISEGESVTFTVTTTDVPTGTVLHWENIGTSTPADFSTPTADTGTFTVGSNGQASITFTALEDQLTEGTETIHLRIRRTNASGELLVSSNSVQITDTSLTRTYSISPNTTSINEGSSVTYSVTTTNVPNGTTLYWTNSGTTVAADFTPAINSGSFTINNNVGSFILTAANDLSSGEGNENIIAKVRTGSTSGTIVATASTVTVVDTSKAPVYGIAPNVTTINEGGIITYTVTTENVPNNTVLYYTNAGTTSGADFTSTVDTGNVTITNNSATFTMTLANDLLTEGSQTVIVKLRTGNVNGTIVATADTVTVNDTSTTPPTYAIATAGNVTSVNEGSTVTFNITTTNVGNGTILYWTNNGTSVAADVYPAAASGSFTINNNAGSVALLAYNDTNTEGAETIIFKVRTGSITGTAVATKTVTINDTSLDPIYYAKYIGCLDEINGVINTLTVSSGSNAWPDVFEYEGICYGFDGTVSSAENGSITQYLTNLYTTCTECTEVHQPATYAVTGPAGINEGGIATFTVTTTNTTDATYYWTLAGVSNADVTPFSGTVTTVSGTKNVSILAYTDETTEGVEFMTFQLRSGSAAGPILATCQVTVNDTSTTPPIGGCYDYTLLNEVGTSASITYYNCTGGVLATTKPKTLTLAPGQQNTTGCTNLDNVTLPYGWSIVDQTPC